MREKRDDLRFSEEVDRVLQAEPFQTFRMTLTSGEVVGIDNRAFMSFGSDVVAVLNPRVGEWIIRRTEVVGLFVPIKK